jgi:LPXTG-motif cell wall-anchored protein
LKTPSSEGAESSEALFGGGLNIGDYGPDQEAIATYQVKIADDQTIFPCGETVVYNLAGASTANGTIHDKVKVTVTRTCEGGNTVVVKTCKDDPTMEGCQELPNTGPAEIVMAVIIIVGIVGGGIYFIRTQAKLKKLESTTTSPKDDSSHKE